MIPDTDNELQMRVYTALERIDDLMNASNLKMLANNISFCGQPTGLTFLVDEDYFLQIFDLDEAVALGETHVFAQGVIVTTPLQAHYITAVFYYNDKMPQVLREIYEDQMKREAEENG